MNERKSQYWKWKSTIIDFDNLSNEKNEYGTYITKKDLIFQQLGTPDKEIHEWYNGKYSSEYNEAYRYAYELNLIEHYRDYEDEIHQLQSNWNSLRECIIGVIEGAREELNTIIHTTDIDTKEGFEYVNQCSREFDVIRKNLEIVLDNMNELEGKNK